MESDYKLQSALLSSRQTFTSITGLKPRTYYSFFVRVLMQNGENIDSKISKIETFDDTPSPIYINSISDITSHSMNISWSYYTDVLAVKFDHYELHYATEPNFIPSNTTLYCKIDSVKYTSCFVTSLNEQTEYYFKVRTYNVLGKYSESPEAIASTYHEAPDPVTLYVPNPNDITESSVKLTWSRSLTKIFAKYEIHMTKYAILDPNVTYTFTPDNTTLVKVITNRNDTSYTINNLTKNEEYFFRILIFDNISYSLSQTLGITATIGGKPVPVELYEPVIESDINTVTLSWSKSISRYFHSYGVLIYPVSDPAPNVFYQVATIIDPTTTKFSTAKLTKGSTYYCRIEVANRMSSISFSNEKSFRIGP
jgi:hypothetical protein